MSNGEELQLKIKTRDELYEQMNEVVESDFVTSEKYKDFTEEQKDHELRVCQAALVVLSSEKYKDDNGAPIVKEKSYDDIQGWKSLSRKEKKAIKKEGKAKLKEARKLAEKKKQAKEAQAKREQAKKDHEKRMEYLTTDVKEKILKNLGGDGKRIEYLHRQVSMVLRPVHYKDGGFATQEDMDNYYWNQDYLKLYTEGKQTVFNNDSKDTPTISKLRKNMMNDIVDEILSINVPKEIDLKWLVENYAAFQRLTELCTCCDDVMLSKENPANNAVYKNMPGKKKQLLDEKITLMNDCITLYADNAFIKAFGFRISNGSDSEAPGDVDVLMKMGLDTYKADYKRYESALKEYKKGLKDEVSNDETEPNEVYYRAK